MAAEIPTIMAGTPVNNKHKYIPEQLIFHLVHIKDYCVNTKAFELCSKDRILCPLFKQG